MRAFFCCSAVLLLSISMFSQGAATKPALTGASTIPASTVPANVLPAGAPTVETCEAYFKRMFGYDSNLTVKVVSIGVSQIPDMFEVVAMFSTGDGQQIGRWYVSKDLKHAVAGELLPFGADPFAADRAVLASSAFGASKGPADGKLLIVEFADLECPACREAAPLMEKLRDDFPQAHFIFQSFPLVALHPWALRAASYLDCIERSTPEHAFTFIDAVFGHQKAIENDVRKTDAAGKTTVDDAAVTERLRHFSEWAGVDPAKTQACAESPATAERVNHSLQVGQSVNITGTPTIFVNGRRIGNPNPAQYEALRSVVAYEAEHVGK